MKGLETEAGAGFETPESKLENTVSQFLRMVDKPERLGTQVETIARETGSQDLSAEASVAMDQLVSSLKAILPPECEHFTDADLRVALRAGL
jgi:hypothetical protein